MSYANIMARSCGEEEEEGGDEEEEGEPPTLQVRSIFRNSSGSIIFFETL